VARYGEATSVISSSRSQDRRRRLRHDARAEGPQEAHAHGARGARGAFPGIDGGGSTGVGDASAWGLSVATGRLRTPGLPVLTGVGKGEKWRWLKNKPGEWLGR